MENFTKQDLKNNMIMLDEGGSIYIVSYYDGAFVQINGCGFLSIDNYDDNLEQPICDQEIYNEFNIVAIWQPSSLYELSEILNNPTKETVMVCAEKVFQAGGHRINQYTNDDILQGFMEILDKLNQIHEELK